MKVSISYPPLANSKGVPLLSQNRQFQWFSEPTYIYPMVPASAATILDQAGYQVIWDDAIAEEKKYGEWLDSINKKQIDVIVIETKTPVIMNHWKIIEDIKTSNPETKVVLVGDHVTALPNESMEKSDVDYILTGGDYDFLLLNLMDNISRDDNNYESGIWYRKNNIIKNSGIFKLNHELNNLTHINRALSNWELYAYNNGNYKKTPGTYTMVGRDCWWRNEGGCEFCSWPTLYPIWRVQKPEKLFGEIISLVDDYNIREIFDDTGTFPVGSWLKTFCNMMIDSGYNKTVDLSCNMRFGVLKESDFQHMKKAGFRMLLFGLESGCQSTLNKLNKGIMVNDIMKDCKAAKESGLEPHITVMIGYPWETTDNIKTTLDLVAELMDSGWIHTLQATVIVPYPGTQLYQHSLDNDWFSIDPKRYDLYDMSKPLLITQDTDPDDIMSFCDDFYKLYLSPKYMYRHFMRVKSWNDVKYSIRGILKVLGHIKDFSKNIQ